MIYPQKHFVRNYCSVLMSSALKKCTNDLSSLFLQLYGRVFLLFLLFVVQFENVMAC